MATLKQSILRQLESNRSKTISGQELATMFNVSRSAIWKAMKALESDGYKIEATTNKGYRLEEQCDCLSAEGIEAGLVTGEDIDIYCYKSLDSTNTQAKELAMSESKRPLIVASEVQTAGRGRFGREFFSPSNSGIYFTLVLRVNLSFTVASRITMLTAVAVSRVLSRITADEISIKWVNDIYYKEKKVCGILTESVGNLEAGIVDTAIVGIGINLIQPESGFPDELQEKTGALFSSKKDLPIIDKTVITRNQVVAMVVDEIFNMLPELESFGFLDEYREHSFLDGKEVLVERGRHQFDAIVRGINDDGTLLVEAGGEIIALESGEVSIRKQST